MKTTIDIEALENDHDLERARRIAAFQIRLKGGSLEDIVATGLYGKVSDAKKALNALMSRDSRETNEAFREMELMRLDELMAAYWPFAVLGTAIKAGEMILKIMDRRARLLGLDAPQKVDISGMIRDAATAAGVDPLALQAEVSRITQQIEAQA